MSRFLLLLAVLLSCSCGSFLSAHENFKEHMSSALGKRITSPHTWAREERHVSVRTLDSGNVEHGYLFRRSCRYFFEVDQHTEVIVRWRFEGSEKDCAIAP